MHTDQNVTAGLQTSLLCLPAQRRTCQWGPSAVLRCLRRSRRVQWRCTVRRLPPSCHPPWLRSWAHWSQPLLLVSPCTPHQFCRKLNRKENLMALALSPFQCIPCDTIIALTAHSLTCGICWCVLVQAASRVWGTCPLLKILHSCDSLTGCRPTCQRRWHCMYTR